MRRAVKRPHAQATFLYAKPNPRRHDPMSEVRISPAAHGDSEDGTGFRIGEGGSTVSRSRASRRCPNVQSLALVFARRARRAFRVYAMLLVATREDPEQARPDQRPCLSGAIHRHTRCRRSRGRQTHRVRRDEPGQRGAGQIMERMDRPYRVGGRLRNTNCDSLSRGAIQQTLRRGRTTRTRRPRETRRLRRNCNAGNGAIAGGRCRDSAGGDRAKRGRYLPPTPTIQGHEPSAKSITSPSTRLVQAKPHAPMPMDVSFGQEGLHGSLVRIPPGLPKRLRKIQGRRPHHQLPAIQPSPPNPRSIALRGQQFRRLQAPRHSYATTQTSITDLP